MKIITLLVALIMVLLLFCACGKFVPALSNSTSQHDNILEAVSNDTDTEDRNSQVYESQILDDTQLFQGLTSQSSTEHIETTSPIESTSSVIEMQKPAKEQLLSIASFLDYNDLKTNNPTKNMANAEQTYLGNTYICNLYVEETFSDHVEASFYGYDPYDGRSIGDSKWRCILYLPYEELLSIDIWEEIKIVGTVDQIVTWTDPRKNWDCWAFVMRDVYYMGHGD